MRLSEYCASQDIDRAIAVTVDSFVASQKVSCKKALARAFAKYGFSCSIDITSFTDHLVDTHSSGQMLRARVEDIHGTVFGEWIVARLLLHRTLGF